MRKFLDEILFVVALFALVSAMVFLVNELMINFSEQRMLEDRQKELKYYSPDTPAYYLRYKEFDRKAKRQ